MRLAARMQKGRAGPRIPRGQRHPETDRNRRAHTAEMPGQPAQRAGGPSLFNYSLCKSRINVHGAGD